MLILDTDHVSEFQRGTSREAERLNLRLSSATDSIATTIISIEETMRGWMADIRRISEPPRLIRAYQRLQDLFGFFAVWEVMGWTEHAAVEFRLLRQAGVRIGTMDLRIACICLEHGATLLTRNAVDFQQVPGLRIENWLD